MLLYAVTCYSIHWPRDAEHLQAALALPDLAAGPCAIHVCVYVCVYIYIYI